MRGSRELSRPELALERTREKSKGTQEMDREEERGQQVFIVVEKSSEAWLHTPCLI
jgi:hypothetical protein